MAEEEKIDKRSPRQKLEDAVKKHLETEGLEIPDDSRLAEASGYNLTTQFLKHKDKGGRVVEEFYPIARRFEIISRKVGLSEEVARDLIHQNRSGK